MMNVSMSTIIMNTIITITDDPQIIGAYRLVIDGRTRATLTDSECKILSDALLQVIRVKP